MQSNIQPAVMAQQVRLSEIANATIDDLKRIVVASADESLKQLAEFRAQVKSRCGDIPCAVGGKLPEPGAKISDCRDLSCIIDQFEHYTKKLQNYAATGKWFGDITKNSGNEVELTQRDYQMLYNEIAIKGRVQMDNLREKIKKPMSLVAKLRNLPRYVYVAIAVVILIVILIVVVGAYKHESLNGPHYFTAPWYVAAPIEESPYAKYPSPIYEPGKTYVADPSKYNDFYCYYRDYITPSGLVETCTKGPMVPGESDYYYHVIGNEKRSMMYN